MRYKRSIIVLALAIFMLSVAGAWASDTNDTMFATGDDSVIELSGEDNDDIMAVDENEDTLKADEQTFGDLNNTINGNNDLNIYLEHDYKYSDGDSAFNEGIVIDRDVYVYGNGHTINGSSQARIFKITSGNVVFHNITFTNGKTTEMGGAAYFGDGATGTLINCNFTGNTADDGGAIYFVEKSAGEVINCNFADNTATSSGGALVFLGKGTVTDCNFIENTGMSGSGGAVYLITGTVTNCNFDNSTGKYGGAVYLGAGTVTNCNFNFNSDSHGGGAIYSEGYSIADTCIFKTSKDRTRNTQIFAPAFNVENFTAFYKSGDKLTFDLKTNSGIPVTNRNISIRVYYKNNGSWVGNYSCMSGAGWTVDLPIGEYYAIYNTEYADLTPLNGTITILSPTGYTFEALNDTINGNDNQVIDLPHDFYFIPHYDAAFAEGIVINRPVTINGNGYAIDAKGYARIFNVLSEGTVIANLTLKNANAQTNGGAVYFDKPGTVINCNFIDNFAIMGKDIFSNQEYSTADTCIFKTGSDTTFNTIITSPTLNIDDFTTCYNPDEKLTLDLKTDSNMQVTNGNISISLFFKGNGSWVGNYSCLSDEGWILDLPVGSYYAIFDTEYAGFQPINRTITITMPDDKYYINVTSLTSNSSTVNITAKSNIPKSILWGGKLLFILPDGSKINATYADDGIWWAIHKFNNECDYLVTASYAGLDNVTVNKGIIYVSIPKFSFWFLNYTINGNDNSVIELSNDFNFIQNYNDDDAFAEGIVINRSVTIKGNGHTIDAKGQARIFNVQSEGVVIENLTFKNANHNGNGGAIYFDGSGTLLNCNFINNTGKSGSGGAVYLSRGAVTNCNFINNSANIYGGAVYLSNGAVTNCNFTDNNAIGSYTNGGAVFLSDGNVSNCNFINNSATQNGGAVYLNDGNVSNCNFINNSGYRYGGAVYLNDGNVSNCNFTNNKATDGYSSGGGVFFSRSGCRMINCNFINNSAADSGGAVAFRYYGELTNCNFTNNSARYGGAVYFLNYGDVKNCNFINNTAATRAGATDFINGGNAINCYFDGNSAPEWGAISVLGTLNYVVADSCIFKTDFDTIDSDAVILLPVLNVDDFTTAYQSGEKLTFDLKTNSGMPIYNRIIYISAYYKNNNSLVCNYSCLSGEGWTVDLLPGSYYAIFDTEFASFQPVNRTIVVKKADSPVEMGIVLDYGASTNVIMAFEGAIGIIAKIDGHNVSVDNFTIPIAGLNAGTHYLKVTSIPDVNHNPVTKNVTIEVNRIQTVLAGNAVTATYNVNKDLVITLKDANGNPVSGASVTVDLNGAKTFITDKNGQIMVSTNGLDPKAYTVKVTFNGNNNYVQSSKSIKVTVKKANPKLTAKKQTFKKSVKIKKYSIVLKNNLGKAIKNAKVFIKVGKKTFKAKTNSKGKAVFKIKKLTKKGTYKAKVTFKGDKYYNKATKKVKITIK